MYRGISAITIDNKGRLTLPTRHRNLLAKNNVNQLIVTIDTESPCLLLYPIQEWQTIEKKIQALSSFNKATRRIQRLLIGHAIEIDIDLSGRVLLPAELRKYANLEKYSVIIGQVNKFEIWATELWQKYRDVWLSETSENPTHASPELELLAL